MPLFRVKIDHDARLPYQTNNPSGNWKMGQNTPQAMGKDVLDTFMPHPGAIPGPGWSKNGYFWGSKTAKMTGCHIEQKNQPGNWIMGQNTPQAIIMDVLGTFMPHPGVIPGPGWPKNGYFRVKKQQKQTM